MQCAEATIRRQLLSLSRPCRPNSRFRQTASSQQCIYRQRTSRSPLSTSARWQASAGAARKDRSAFAPEELPSPLPNRSIGSAKLAALHARLSLPSRLPTQTLARALIDRTADPDSRFNNESLAILGADILALYTSEHLMCHYPRLPMDVLFAAVSAYVGPKALSVIAREWGIEHAAEPGGEVDPGLLQYANALPGENPSSNMGPQAGRPNEKEAWRRGMSSRVVYDDEFGSLRRRTDEQLPTVTTPEEASALCVRAIVASIQLHAGKPTAKRFWQAHFQSRSLNLSSIFDFKRPTQDLSKLCAREGFEAPVARLESETGRLSRHPVFVVGVYSGRDKLGEGAGSSLDEARVRAAAAALKGWYLYSPIEVVTPSEVEVGLESGKAWKPNLIDVGEIVS